MIRLQEISKKFNGTQAIHPLCFDIPDGCIFGVIGSNGAGKSTLLRLCAGVYRADSGSILLDGMPVYENPKAKQQIVFVSDDPYFLPGADMRRMAKLYSAVYPHFDRKRFAELSAAFGLDVKKNIQAFSKGVRRQVAIVLALCCRARYLLFDESFDGLDPVVRNLVKGLLCQQVAQDGCTVVVTSHSMRELEGLCDCVALLHKGKLTLHSDIHQLKSSLIKVQAAFRQPPQAQAFAALQPLHLSISGSIVQMIVRADAEQVAAQLRETEPLLLETLPLTLEEIFVYELQTQGYSFTEPMGGIG